MITNYLHMKWGHILLIGITKEYQSKIISLMQTKPESKLWFGYTQKQWLDAFSAKDEYLQQLQKDNYEASLRIKQIKRNKEFRVERASYKILTGICKAFQITDL